MYDSLDQMAFCLFLTSLIIDELIHFKQGRLLSQASLHQVCQDTDWFSFGFFNYLAEFVSDLLYTYSCYCWFVDHMQLLLSFLNINQKGRSLG